MNDLAEFVKNYRESNPTGWRKWVYGSLAALAAVIVIATISVLAAMRAKEMSDLEADRDKLKNDIRKAKLDAKLASRDADKAKHEDAAEKAMEAAAELEAKLHELRKDHATEQDIINSIRSWEDVDKKVK